MQQKSEIDCLNAAEQLSADILKVCIEHCIDLDQKKIRF